MLRSMVQVYVKNSGRAVAFYQNVFGAKTHCLHLNADGTVLHAELDVFGMTLAVSESIELEPATGNTLQICLHFGAEKEETARRVIEQLGEGGRFTFRGSTGWSPLMAGIVDPFGVWWCVYV